MKNYLLSFVFFTFFYGIKAQTNISGIINSYAAVININVQACVSNNLTVDDASGFTIGDSILIIQMQGADISPNDDVNFGDISALNSAGLYEKNVILNITGNIITLGLELVNNYDVNGAVQIVNIPHYIGDVNVNAILNSSFWDGSKGGVLAFTTSGDVIMNANISVRRRGFRGGNNVIQANYSCNFVTSRNDYYYPLNSENGSGKGEGISKFINDREAGRGKQANGGGGGNDHNAGGAGGGNASSGGNGGTNSEPGTFNCKGNFPGVGGLALDYTQNRIYFGGGGGAGHGNNAAYTAPNGAGIVYIKANSIIGNGRTILADGFDGGLVSNDGGIGASAGGTVLLEVNTWGTGLTINTSGGNGGNTANIGNRCYGPGGGGGAGALIYNLASYTNTYISNAGTAGVVTTSTNSCNGSNLSATDGGGLGLSIANRVVPISNIAFSSGSTINPGLVITPQSVCEGGSFQYFTSADAGYSYQWQIDSSGTWENLIANTNYSNVTTPDLTISNAFERLENFAFRLMVFAGCDTAYTNTGTVIVNSRPTVTIQPTSQSSCNGGNATFFVEGSDVVSYQWQRLNGSFQNLNNNAQFSGTTNDTLQIVNIDPTLNGASFRVVLTNSCGNTFSNIVNLNFLVQNITINNTPDSLNVCEGNDSLIYADYIGTVDSIVWQVNDGLGFVDLINSANYQGVDNDTLRLNNISVLNDDYTYRALLFNDCGANAISDTTILKVYESPSISINPTFNLCEAQGIFVSISNIVGTNITYQWQVDSSGVWEDLTNTAGYSNTTGSFLGFASSIVVPSISTDDYRVQINTDCGPATSNIFNLIVSAKPVITTQPSNDTICQNGAANFTANVSDAAAYQWQSNSSGTFTNLSNNATYNGVNTNSLTVNNVSASEIGVDFRLVISGTSPCTAVTSNTATIILSDSAEITNQSTNQTICEDDSLVFFVETINNNSFQWQINNGGTFVNLNNNANYNGVQTDSLQINDVQNTFNGNNYRCIITGVCNNDTSAIITLNVTPVPVNYYPLSLCSGDSLITSNGTVLKTPIVFNDTIKNASSLGCDSVVFYDLSFINPPQSNQFPVICFGDSLVLSDGTSVKNSGIYNDTLTNASADGCDSILVYDLTVNPIAQNNQSIVLCFGDSFQLSDLSFVSTTGIYNDTISNGAANTCDSIVVYDITVSPEISENVNVSICNDDSLVLSNGSAYNTTGVYNDTLANSSVNGCDSIVIYNLTVNTPAQNNQSIVLCFGDSFQLSDLSFVSATGIYNDTISNGAANTCDSIVVYDITVSPEINENVNVSICSNDSLVLSDGTAYNTTGIYNDTLQNASSDGCDSIIIYNLTITSTQFILNPQTICEGDSYTLPSGTIVNVANTYMDTIQSTNACDSIIQTDLTVLQNSNSNITDSFCFGDSYTLASNRIVNTGGVYNDTLFAQANNGCDSIIVYDLTVNPIAQNNQSVVLCFGDSFQLSDLSFVSATGIYNDTISNGAANTCDSIVVYDITISPEISENVNVSICNDDSLVLSNGSAYNTTGVYNDTLANSSVNGCDSIVIYNLTVNTPAQNNQSIVLCFGDSFQLSDLSFVSATGIYNDTISNGAANTCDSIVVYDITVSPEINENVNVSICSNDSLVLSDGTAYNTTGIYNDTLQNASSDGCDSIIIYNLTITSTQFTLNPQTICEGDSYTLPSGTIVNVANTYMDTIPSTNLCDSVIQTDLTVLQNSSSTINDNFCAGGTYTLPSNAIVNLAGIYNDTLFAQANNGCDSIVIVNLTENPAPAPILINDTICFNQNYTLPSGATVNTAAIYADTFQNALGCDSLINVDLFVKNANSITFQSTDVEACLGADVLFFVQSQIQNVSYQWFENGAILTGENNDTLNLININNTLHNNVYTCEITSDCDVLTSNNFTLNLSDESQILNQSTDIAQCGGFSFDLFVDATNIATYQWQIDEGAGFVNLSDGALGTNGTQISGANTAELTVSNFDETISGASFQVVMTNICGITPIFVPVNVTISSPVELSNTINDTSFCLTEIQEVFVPYVSATAQWSNGDVGQSFLPDATGNYIVSFIDENDCPNQDEIFVELKDCLAECFVIAPTGFSPNLSGINDGFKTIYNCPLSFYEMSIYNRWGELVFYSTDITQAWEGTYRNKNAEIGTYTYFVNYQIEGESEKEILKGNITLIR